MAVLYLKNGQGNDTEVKFKIEIYLAMKEETKIKVDTKSRRRIIGKKVVN